MVHKPQNTSFTSPDWDNPPLFVLHMSPPPFPGTAAHVGGFQQQVAVVTIQKTVGGTKCG